MTEPHLAHSSLMSCRYSNIKLKFSSNSAGSKRFLITTTRSFFGRSPLSLSGCHANNLDRKIGLYEYTQIHYFLSTIEHFKPVMEKKLITMVGIDAGALYLIKLNLTFII